VRRLADALFTLALTLWVGGLWAIGYLVAPTLFASLGDRQLAGALAGKLFALIGWVGMACAAYMLIFLIVRLGGTVFKRALFWLLVVMLVLTLVSQFGLQPLIAELKAQAMPREVMESVLRDRFATWHGISSILYLVQSVLGLLLALVGARGAR
jgi:hypothetical protein